MRIQEILSNHIKTAFTKLYGASLESVEFQATRKDFEGDITVVTFPMLRMVKMNPASLGEELGAYLKENEALVADYNVVKGFLNLVLVNSYFINAFEAMYSASN